MPTPQMHWRPFTKADKHWQRCSWTASLTVLCWLWLPQPSLANKDKFDLTVHEKQPAIIGRVTDCALKPVASVQLKLTSTDSPMKASAVTKSDGAFEITHTPCKLCLLEVYPPKGSRLASARLDNLSGETTRRLIIQLHEGLEIVGRVIGDGKGLKGLDLSFVPAEAKSSKRPSVHGSGLTKTGKNGSFALTVTSGLNHLSIENDRYPQFAKHFETNINVTTGGEVAEITLPPAQNTN